MSQTGIPDETDAMVKRESGIEDLVRELLGNVNVRTAGIKNILDVPEVTETSVLEAYQFLRSKNIKDEKIASHIHLLGKGLEILEPTYYSLEKMGLTTTQIATHASLLGLNPRSVRSKYDFLVGLLRDDYADRNSGKEAVLGNPVLLGSSRVTVESNTQFLYSLGVNLRENLGLLGTTMKKKREKMAWMLNELFDYGGAFPEEKKDLIYSMRDLVRDKPDLLFRSVNYLEERKDVLRQDAARYGKATNAAHWSPGLFTKEFLSDLEDHALFIAREFYRNGLSVERDDQKLGVPLSYVSEQLKEDKRAGNYIVYGKFTAGHYFELLKNTEIVKEFGREYYVPVDILQQE